MSLLVLQRVSKRFCTGKREVVALCDVSLDIAPGEFVAVWGLRRSGRSTLLRVASGLLPPDDGVVCFDGREIGESSPLGTRLGYCTQVFSAAQGGAIVDYVAVGLLAQSVPVTQATAQAHDALDRVGAGHCARLDPRELHPHELVRAGIARALVARPRMLLLDEPVNGVDLIERDPIVDLLRGLVGDGLAVLMTIGETVGGIDRMLVVDGGRLRGDNVPDPATVVPLRRAGAEHNG